MASFFCYFGTISEYHKNRQGGKIILVSLAKHADDVQQHDHKGNAPGADFCGRSVCAIGGIIYYDAPEAVFLVSVPIFAPQPRDG